LVRRGHETRRQVRDVEGVEKVWNGQGAVVVIQNLGGGRKLPSGVRADLRPKTMLVFSECDRMPLLDREPSAVIKFVRPRTSELG